MVLLDCTRYNYNSLPLDICQVNWAVWQSKSIERRTFVAQVHPNNSGNLFCHASIMDQGSGPWEVHVHRTHFHRVSNGFNLKSAVVTVVTDRNFTLRTTTA